MPHSSGGGSSGGGFHGGSSSGSSTPTRRYSSRPFTGAVGYVYYDRRFRPHVIYANNDPEPTGKASWLIYVLYGILMLVPWVFAIVTGIHHPAKLETNYDTSIVIRDDNETLTVEEKDSLTNTFNHFLDITGITPAYISVDYSRTSEYESLEDYAYQRYVKSFADERHWLIVYSSRQSTAKENWAFEGMQGNDTDPILYTEVTDRFNSVLYNALSEPSTRIGEALIRAFDDITPGILDQKFIFSWKAAVFCSIWSGLFIILTVNQIRISLNRANMKKAVPLPESNSLKTCPYCGNSYYAETVDRCPKCGSEVEFPRYAHFPHEEE